MSALELSGVTKVYGSGAGAVHALRGVDLCVEPGELVAVMGPSGSGKLPVDVEIQLQPLRQTLRDDVPARQVVNGGFDHAGCHRHPVRLVLADRVASQRGADR